MTLKIRSMETENDCFETQNKGFRLIIRLAGQTLKIMMNFKESKKKYQSDLSYQVQSDNFKFAFGDMQQAFQYIKDELTAKSEMIKISSEGKLQIGYKVKQKVRYLPLEIQQVELQQSERLIQVTSLIKKDVQTLKINIEEVKANFDEQQANILRIKQELKGKIDDLKFQLLGAINLKSDVKATDGKIACLKQEVIKKLVQIQNKSQLDISIAQVKTQFENLLSRESKNKEDKVKEANTKIQELKKQVKQLAKNSQVLLIRHTELEKQLKRNAKEQLRSLAQTKEVQLKNRPQESTIQIKKKSQEQFSNLAQTREVQKILQSRLQEQAKKLKLVEILLNYKFPEMMESRFFPLTVDPNIGQFKGKYFKMINDRMFQKVNDIYYRQAVSREQLPKKGKYYFQVMFHYSSDSQPKYIKALVGITTQDQRNNQYSYDNKQSISYCLGNGQIFENGSRRKVGTTLYSRRGLVTVIIDADLKKISWCYDHQLLGSTIISKTIMDKNIYAFVDVAYQGTILQFKSQ